MARTESVLTIFLASPGDVLEERNRLEDAIADWNRTWARNLGIRLELLRWEQDAYPDVGDDAQDVINQQLPQDYDLFVGLMWSRFGTPTTRAGSGTAEEFERALARSRASRDVNILFYFKDTPIPPSQLDPAQLQRLHEFKKSLKLEGVLHWHFSDSEQFEKLVSMHITKHVQNWRQRQQTTTPELNSLVLVSASPTEVETPHIGHIDEDEDGYFDLLETFEERSAEVNEIANRLTDAQTELTARMSQGTLDMEALVASPNGASPAQARRLIGKVAEEMLQFTNRVNAEVPLFRGAMNGSMNALTRAATLSAEFDNEQTRTAKTAATLLLAALSDARLSMVGFKASIVALPRMTKELNSAKRQQAAAVDALISEFANGEQLLVEALTVFDTLLQRPRPSDA